MHHGQPHHVEMLLKCTLLINPGRASCTNYFMSIQILRFSVQLIKIQRPDKKFSGKNEAFHLDMSPLPGYHERLRTDENSIILCCRVSDVELT